MRSLFFKDSEGEEWEILDSPIQIVKGGIFVIDYPVARVSDGKFDLRSWQLIKHVYKKNPREALRRVRVLGGVKPYEAYLINFHNDEDSTACALVENDEGDVDSVQAHLVKFVDVGGE